MPTDGPGPPRPPVTVVDPSAPAPAPGPPGPPEPALWRPGRRTWSVVAGGLALVVAVTAVRGEVGRAHARAAAARRALAGAGVLALRIGGPGPSTSLPGVATVGLRLVNDGPRPVRLEAASLDVAGWTVVLPAEPIDPAGSALLDLRRRVDCAGVEALPDPALLRLSVRTADGRTRPLPLGLGPQDGADPARQVRTELNATPRRACGLLSAADALSLQTDSTHALRARRAVRLAVQVRNASTRPLTLLTVRGLDGLSVAGTGRLPLRLAARGSTPLALELTLAGCGPRPRQARLALTVVGGGAAYAEVAAPLDRRAVQSLGALGVHRCR